MGLVACVAFGPKAGLRIYLTVRWIRNMKKQRYITGFWVLLAIFLLEVARWVYLFRYFFSIRLTFYSPVFWVYISWFPLLVIIEGVVYLTRKKAVRLSWAKWHVALISAAFLCSMLFIFQTFFRRLGFLKADPEWLRRISVLIGFAYWSILILSQVAFTMALTRGKTDEEEPESDSENILDGIAD